MMLFAMAALLQAAQPAPTAPTQTAPMPAWRAAGRAWGDCVKRRIDARLTASDTAEALTDASIAGCSGELAAVRSAIAGESGAEIAAANVERVRNGGRAMFIAYVTTARSRAAGGATPPTP